MFVELSTESNPHFQYSHDPAWNRTCEVLIVSSERRFALASFFVVCHIFILPASAAFIFVYMRRPSISRAWRFSSSRSLLCSACYTYVVVRPFVCLCLCCCCWLVPTASGPRLPFSCQSSLLLSSFMTTSSARLASHDVGRH